MSVAESTAHDLLAIGAVILRPDDPFTWASGIRSPMYCDNRVTLGFPEVRARIEAALADLITREYPTAQALMGTAMAGIPHAALAAHKLGLPMGYVRPKAKDHGRGNLIEGGGPAGSRVVVVEDLISTGESVLDTVAALRGAGYEVLGIASLFTYGLAASRENLAAAEVINHSLTDFPTLIRVAVAEGYVGPADQVRLERFIADPASTAWMAPGTPADGARQDARGDNAETSGGVGQTEPSPLSHNAPSGGVGQTEPSPLSHNAPMAD